MGAKSTEADRAGAAPNLYRKLLLLTGLRLLVGTALLLATVWLTLSDGQSFGRRVDVLLYSTIGSIYLVSLIAAFFLRSGRYLRTIAYTQIAGDVLSASGLVYLTGGAESIFTILYPLAIVNAAISLSRRGAMMGAATAGAAFCTLSLLMERGLVSPPPFLERSPLSAGQLGLALGANVSAFFLAAALSAHLADALQGARRQLAQSETKLTALSALHQSIVRSISTGLLTIDGAARMTFLNRAGEEILGVALREAAGRTVPECFPELAEAMQRTRPGRGETLIHHPDGTVRSLGYSVAPLVDTEPLAPPGSVIVFQDLTPFREMEEAMRRSDRLAAVGKLAAGLAHEIRNPLASMCGSIELLGQAPGLADKDRRLMGIVLREGERLEALVRDFLHFARPTPPHLRSVGASRLLEEALAVFVSDAAARGLSLTTEVAPGVVVNADASQLKQVLWNLLSNAAEACDGKGAVRVRLGREGDCAVLEVEDSGAGIDPADLPRIFDPFFTTKEKGTGLGLAIVHRIVEAHGGRILVNSARGRGSLFRVELPAVESKAQVVESGAGAARPAAAALAGVD
jgi:two-component system sensor histidine kinase PilS (NtrC family)